MTAALAQLFLIFVLCLLTLEPDTRTALYVMPLWYIGLLLAYRRRVKVRARPLAATVS
ncbi:D-serine/D-alanine/glycine transporter [compost metagenome]